MQQWASCFQLPGPGKCHPLGALWLVLIPFLFPVHPQPHMLGEHPASMPEQSSHRSVMLVMSVWGFLERELIGKANTPWPDADTGATLKPSATSNPAGMLAGWVSLSKHLSQCRGADAGLRASGMGKGLLCHARA